jgi:hypothetical protein
MFSTDIIILVLASKAADGQTLSVGKTLRVCDMGGHRRTYLHSLHSYGVSEVLGAQKIQVLLSGIFWVFSI